MLPSSFSAAVEEDEVAESQEALVTPLLLHNTNNTITSNSTSPHHPAEGPAVAAPDTTVAAAVTASASNMLPTTASGNSSFLLAARRLSDPRFCPPAIQGCLFRFLACKSAADALPSPFHAVVTNGKIASAAVLGVNLFLIALWLPFYLLSKLITEWGIYLGLVFTIFFVGRIIIRMLAFPGASRKVTLDLEREFSRYALRMLVTALGAVREAAGCLLQAETNPQKAQQMLPRFWKAAEANRNRVLAVLNEVLMVLFQQPNAESFQRSNSGGGMADPSEELTKYGNSRIVGDIGNLGAMTAEARNNGRLIMEKLQEIMMLTDMLEETIQLFLYQNRNQPISAEAIASAKKLVEVCTSLIDFCGQSFPQPRDDENDEEAGDDSPVGGINANNSASIFESVKNGFSSILPMLDPSPHASIFGMDVLRGCVLSRFRGARQLWVRRAQGSGMIDVLHFPAIASTQDSNTKNKKAVLYCNPNAGLMEISTGLSMLGGNVPASEADVNAPRDSWTDFYTEQGFDVYLFNYAGYGRSYGTTNCSSTSPSEQNGGGESLAARIIRIFRSCFLSFQPRPDTLRDDGIAVAEHILFEEGTVQQLVIHGESIGGMAASGVAKHLTKSHSNGKKVAMLVCDRTFCNLEAVAQRLVGSWTGYAIRALTFFVWSTDVAGDFLAADCPKAVCQDAADAIIADEASLKSGVAIWKEVHRGLSSTHGIAWMRETPLHIRMSDQTNSPLNDTKYMAGAFRHVQAPVWPTDKHVSVEEAFHFAACCKRIGKMATSIKRELRGIVEDDGTSLDTTISSPASEVPAAIEAWKQLATCDGMVGAPLGASVKRGFDSTIAWLCCTLVFGGQLLVASAEKRLGAPLTRQTLVSIETSDFDQRTTSLATDGGGTPQPTPIPEVASALERILQQGDSNVENLKHEFQFVLAMLRYIQARLVAAPSLEMAWRNREMTATLDNSVGSFVKLNCGHNASFLPQEKQRLIELIRHATDTKSGGGGHQFGPQ